MKFSSKAEHAYHSRWILSRPHRQLQHHLSQTHHYTQFPRLHWRTLPISPHHHNHFPPVALHHLCSWKLLCQKLHVADVHITGYSGTLYIRIAMVFCISPRKFSSYFHFKSLPLVCMRSKGTVVVSVCLLVCLSACLSLTQHLTSQMFICPTNNTTNFN